MSELQFEIINKDLSSLARHGRIVTAHGVIETPTFMPVATYGSIRLLDFEDIKRIGSQIVLGNTLHLGCTVGAERIKKFGGFAKFANWNGPTLTDSGGYQVSYMWRSGTHSSNKGNRCLNSESPIERITDKGVWVRNTWTGEKFRMTPEKSIEWQAAIGADIAMAFDQPTFDTDTYDLAKASLKRSHDWTIRSYNHWKELKALGLAPNYQSFFPIIQGGRFYDLRRESAKMMCSLNTKGIAIAGESIGIDPNISAETIEMVSDIIPKEIPLYGMGLGGGPEGFLKAVRKGIDMFDNTSPTRMGRCGIAYISPETNGNVRNKFRLSLKKGKHRDSSEPIDRVCDCYVCKNYSRGYIKHLFNIGESVGPRLVTYHNLYFMEQLGKEIRISIDNGLFNDLYNKWIN